MGINRFFRKFATVFFGALLGLTLLGASPASAARPANDVEFKAFSLWFSIGDLSNSGSCIPAWATIRYRDPHTGSDTWTRLVRTNGNGCSNNVEHLNTWGDFQNNNSHVQLVGGPAPTRRLYWKDITSITATVTTPNTPPGRNKNIRVTKFNFDALDTNNNWHNLYNEDTNFVFADGRNDREMFIKH
ncbi:hypothetical protein [Crossiella sp. NPDC003009]